ncbi:hypothetical protein JIN85_19960 [Luteolibacter pohnpeiensis]|uniref:Uncharacterized protein n=1 Tax=Luteolibacter pohnpeiensis TaxID=454153 RepID=A0A934SEK8_9BACT|nr:hypothetical protein [Luteolibacter pohnpeiensis]MBK1884697.1 hypothetical protein [Luteolibacter pohnpeiensis]
MESYHGTSSANAAALTSGVIDVTLGGGELGRGFYSGEHLHEAKAWAFHTSGDRTSNVVKLATEDDQVEALDLKLMDAGSAGLARYRIRTAGETRTFVFGHDMIWSPIVGSEKVSGDQYKWESDTSALLLNDSARTTREVV